MCLFDGLSVLYRLTAETSAQTSEILTYEAEIQTIEMKSACVRTNP